MARTAPTSRIRGRIQAYDCATLEDIDRHLRQLTASWAKLLEPTDKMAADYRHDVNALLDRRNTLQKTVR